MPDECNYSKHMATITTKLARIGNSKGLRIPAPLILKYHLERGVVLEESDGGLLIKGAGKPKKLSWEETAREMAADGEDWSAWESMKDGFDDA